MIVARLTRLCLRGTVLAETGGPGILRLRRRKFVLLGVAGLAIAASVGGLLVATSIKSPAQQAASTAAPPVTRLSAPVTRQVITSTVQAQGAVGQPPEVSQLQGANSGSGTSGALPVVTKVFHRRGSLVEPGNVIVEVAGRPLFVLAGAVPAYRTLAPGETGSDVTQLQQGLQFLGYSTGGEGTKGPKTVPEATVPLSDILFVPHFPARVVKVAGPVGQEASGSLVTLSMGNPAIAGQLSPSDAALVRRGMTVTVTSAATGVTRKGRVASVGQRTKTKGSISGGVYLPLKISLGRPLPTSLIGQDVSLTITAARSTGPVMAVPEAALFARADGRLYVTKITGSHTSMQVPVRVGVTGNGLVGVTPIGGGSLAPGDKVAIGPGYVQNPRAP